MDIVVLVLGWKPLNNNIVYGVLHELFTPPQLFYFWDKEYLTIIAPFVLVDLKYEVSFDQYQWEPFIYVILRFYSICKNTVNIKLK